MDHFTLYVYNATLNCQKNRHNKKRMENEYIVVLTM